MMTVYEYEDGEWGWIVHDNLDSLMEAIRLDVEGAANYPPDDFEVTVRIREMTEEEFAKLPNTDDL